MIRLTYVGHWDWDPPISIWSGRYDKEGQGDRFSLSFFLSGAWRK